MICLAAIVLWMTTQNADADGYVLRNFHKLTPCVVLEMSDFIYETKGSIPAVLEVNFDVKQDEMYEKFFGQGSSKTKIHAANYKCVGDIVGKLRGLSSSFVHRLLVALNTRRKSFLSNGTFLEMPLHTELHRPSRNGKARRRKSKQKASNRSMRSPSQAAYGDVVKTNDTVLAKGDIEEMDLDISIAPNMDSREKRGSTAAIGILLGLGNLAANLGEGVYFGARIERMYDYIDRLIKQMDQNDKWAASVMRNLEVIKDESSLIAVRSDNLYAMLNRLGETNACMVARNELVFEMQALATHFENLYSDLITGTVTTRVIDVDTLVEMFRKTSIDDDTYLQRQPLAFFQNAKLSLLSVDEKKLSVRLLLAVPKIDKSPSYVRINIHNPDSTIAIDKAIFNRKLSLGSSEMAIPISVALGKRFDARHLDKTQIDQLWIPMSCNMHASILACRDMIPLANRQKECLLALTRNDTALFKMCDVSMVKQNDHTKVSISRGNTGLAISVTQEHKLYGIDITQPKAYREEVITRSNWDRKNAGMCGWLDSTYTVVRIVGPEGNFTITQDVVYHMRTNLFEKVRGFHIQHYHWYATDIGDFENEHLENLTVIDKRMSLEEMKRVKVWIGHSTEGWGYMDILLFATAASVGLLWFMKIRDGLGYLFGRFRPDVDQAAAMGQQRRPLAWIRDLLWPRNANQGEPDIPMGNVQGVVAPPGQE